MQRSTGRLGKAVVSSGRGETEGKQIRRSGWDSALTESTISREFTKLSIPFYVPEIFHNFFFKLGENKKVGVGGSHHRSLFCLPPQKLSQFRHPGKGQRTTRLPARKPGLGTVGLS